jgi:hypothetical protein
VTTRSVWRAYVAAPLGAVAFAVFLSVLNTAQSGPLSVPERLVDSLKLYVSFALIVSYPCGLLLLPIYFVFERLGWRGPKYYVPTAAFAGLVAAVVMAYPLFSEPWTFYAVYCASSVSCAVVFSIVLQKA